MTMVELLKEIHGEIHGLRATLMKLENIALFVPVEARTFQIRMAMDSDAENTKAEHAHVKALIDSLKSRTQPAPFDQITRILEDTWGQAVEYWPDAAVLNDDTADQLINRAILVGALLDSLLQAIHQSTREDGS